MVDYDDDATLEEAWRVLGLFCASRRIWAAAEILDKLQPQPTEVIGAVLDAIGYDPAVEELFSPEDFATARLWLDQQTNRRGKR